MKMKLNFCEKKARKPLVSLEKNIAEHFCSAMMVGEGGFEPPKALLTDLQSAPFGHSGIPPYLVCSDTISFRMGNVKNNLRRNGEILRLNEMHIGTFHLRRIVL